MAVSFNELMQKYVNTDYEDLKTIAQKALVEIMPACEKVDPENKGMVMITGLILAAVSADGVLTKLEKQFLGDILGQSGETIDKLVTLYCGKEAALADQFVDNLGVDVKVNTVTLIACIAAVDEKIARDETALIHKLIEG